MDELDSASEVDLKTGKQTSGGMSWGQYHRTKILQLFIHLFIHWGRGGREV